jgi:hypothetical protein
MPIAAPNLVREFGGSYGARHPSDRVLRVHDGDALLPGERVIGRFPVLGLDLKRPKVVTVGLLTGAAG